eukprot:1168542-Prymnesium_polylepis.1
MLGYGSRYAREWKKHDPSFFTRCARRVRSSKSFCRLNGMSWSPSGNAHRGTPMLTLRPDRFGTSDMAL